MNVSSRQQRVVKDVQAAQSEWNQLQEQCCTLLSVVVRHYQQMDVLSNPHAQGVLAHIPQAIDLTKAKLLAEIDSAMKMVFSSLLELGKIVKSFEQAYLTGRDLYECNKDRFENPEIRELPLPDDYLQFLQMNYKLHSLQYLQFKDTFNAFEHATSQKMRQALLQQTLEPTYLRNLPPAPKAGAKRQSA